ncbi:hypothetical protein [Pseudoxanthomonas daejeonensis]|uniref:Secreted protein n=1 Tax=Pseudoxanthomonas daejeonensis TaxID=266062 RepID=A0ABQ6Z430_9GAMM|nr:hypothetical protein [Pseudoxanthomonas daejeonensis]KAF1692213.1 hypothetical protein CSC65_14720 [Pseudoxanthomonas daejeonensis]
MARIVVAMLGMALTLVAHATPLLPAAGAAPESDVHARTVVFIGQKLSIEPLPDPCAEKAKQTGVLDCISMDSLYRATYRVVQPVVGETVGEAMTFSVADHYGFPYFAHFTHALLFVEVGKDGAWLHKYQAIPMFRTADGQWAACGDMDYRSDQKPLVAQARPMAFAEPMLTVGTLDADARERLASRWKQAPDTYRVTRGQLHCLKGVPVGEAYEIVRQGVMDAREVPLPAWPAGT